MGLLIPPPRDLPGEAGQQLRRGHELLLHGEELRIHGATGHDVTCDVDHGVQPPAERTRGHGHLVQPTDRVRDVPPGSAKILGAHLISGYAGDGSGDQAGARITGVPVEDPGTRYALTAQPGDPVVFGLQTGRVRGGHALGVPGGVHGTEDGSPRFAAW